MERRKKISFPTIVAAKNGDAEAMTAILHHYRPYINHFSKRTFRDEYGNTVEIIDDDIRQHIEAALMLQIVYKFDCISLPAGETLEQNSVTEVEE